MDQIEWTLLALATGILFSAFIIWRLQSYRKSTAYQHGEGVLHRLLKIEEKMITGFESKLGSFFQTRHRPEVQPHHLLEILLLGVWAFWVGRDYLNLNPQIIPSGREFNSAIQSHHLWTRFRECGWCALWNGTARGGNPSFADSYGSMLHPLVVVTTLLWGVVNGAKITLVLSFWTAGIAQWWIAREMKFSRIARLWSGGLAVVGGHLAGRMELGLFGIILSTAMTSLLYGGILAVVNRPGVRSAVLLGLVGGSALLAGQGYLQLAFAGTLPAFAFLLLDKELRWKPIRKYFLLALGLAVLLSAVFFLPFFHFSPQFTKYLDPEFKVAQPLQFLPLNYLIDTFEYYHSDALGKHPFPSLYTLFLGWIPMMLAVYGLTEEEKINRRLQWFLVTSLFMILLFASGTALRPLAKIWEAAAGFRHPSLMAGLTVPIILTFSGAGLDKLLRQPWPRLELNFSDESPLESWAFPSRWILAVPLVFSLIQGYRFTEIWIHTQEINPEVYQVVQALETESTQWVQPPFGEHIYIEPAVLKGLKLSPGIIPWRWKDRELPVAYLEASHSGPPNETAGVVERVNEIAIYQRPQEEYAVIQNGDQITPCRADGQGGKIEVSCRADRDGQLLVREYFWSGWRGWRDGERVDLLNSQWISLEAPAGYHTYLFRYRPWDVPLGLGLSLLGLVLCLGLWLLDASSGKTSGRGAQNQ